MLSHKGFILCFGDDSVVKLVIDNIFPEGITKLDLPTFCNSIK
jgi:hypothetical protein